MRNKVLTFLKLPKNLRIQNRTRRKALSTLLVAVLVVASVQIWGYLRPDSAAAWFDEGYLYRQPFSFTHNAAIASLRKVTFSLDTAELISAGVMQSDCDDTRFTGPTGISLDFELTGTCNNAATTYEVIFPETINGGNAAYVYYGNPSAVNAEVDTTSITALTPSGGDPSITSRTSEEKGPGPILWFKFDEGVDNTCPDGTDVCDSSSPANNGTVGEGIQTGDGHDGALTSSFSSFEYEGVNATSGSGQANQDRIEVASTTNITSGDDVLVIQMSGTGQGNWETCDVESVVTDDYIDCEQNLTNTYQSSGAQIVVMPQWTDVTLGSSESITTSAWNGTTGGIIAFRASGTVTVESGGSIDADELGFSGGATTSGGSGGTGGTPPSGLGTDGGAANAGNAGTGPGAGNGGSAGGDFGSGPTTTGGRGGGGAAGGSGGGAGGSYGSVGTAGSAGNGSGFDGGAGGSTGGGVGGTGSNGSGGSVGSTYGTASLSSIYLGSGGGSGGSGAGGGGGGSGAADVGTAGGSGGTGGAGGVGGGIVFVQANAISVDGTITNNGASGSNGTNGNQGVDSGNANQGHGGGGAPGAGGGGGSGGAIYLSGNSVDVGSSLVGASGGSGGTAGSLAGDGGDGNRTGGTGNSNGAGGGSSQATFGGQPTATSGEGPGDGSIGGNGRIHIEYSSSITGTTSPTADEESVGIPGDWRGPDMCFNDKCLYYDGSDAVVTVTNSTEIDLNGELSEALTVQGWIRANSDGENNQGEIFDKGANTYMRITNEGADGFADLETSLDLGTADATLSISNGITLNKWHHVAVTYEDDGDDEITVYIDGVNQGSSSNGSGSPAAESNDLTIGGDSTHNFHGFIDEFKIYHYARSQSEIESELPDHSASSGVSASFGRNDSFLSQGLLGYWNLDEASGNVADRSGNNYTLTNNGTTTFEAAKFGNGSEHVPASSQYFSTASQISDVSSVSFWTNPDSDTNYFLSLTSGAYITSSSGTISSTGLTNARTYVNGNETTTIVANEWQHIVVTFDPIDASQLYVGRQGSNYYDGTIDEIRLYNRVLPRNEVEYLYNWAPEPIGYWNFDENTGTGIAYDRSTNQRNATLTSTTEADWVLGKFGSGLTYDGSSDYATVTSEDANFSINHYSVSAWINRTTDSGGIEAIVDNRDADNDGWLLSIDASDTVTCSYNSVDTTSTTTMSTGTWYHVGCTADGTNVNIYINGVNEANTAQSGSISETTDMRIATQSYGTSQKFAGVVDDVRVYNYARTAGQIVEAMNGDHPLGGSPIASQVAYWSFDEQYGTTANNRNPNNPSITGSISGATWLTEHSDNCKVNGCLDYDGTDDVTTVSNATSIDFDDNLNSGFTVTAWINADSDGENNTGEIFKKGTTYCRTDNQGSTDLDLECNLDLATTDANVNITDGLTTDTWHHIAITHDGISNIEVFIDGISRGSNTGSGSKSNDTNNFLIGGDTSNNFDGSIDEFKIYSAKLTAEQIRIDRTANSALSLGGVLGNSEASLTEDGAGNPPVGYWPMDENTGTSTTYDKSGNGNNASFVGSIAEDDWVPGKYGSALDHDGADDEVTITNTNVIDLDGGLASESTFTTWVYVRSDGEDDQGRVFHKLSNTYIQVENESGGAVDVRFSYHLLNNSATIVITDGFNVNQWHHVAMTYEDDADDEITVYIDGVNRGTSTNGNGSSAADTADLVIGGMSGNTARNFDGIIDEFKIFSYELTATQIVYEYNRGAPMHWYRFDECTGTTINDITGNANTGTWSGSSGSNTSTGSCESGTSSEAWNDGTTGKYTSALGYDGTDDVVTITMPANIDVLGGRGTITFWARPDWNSTTTTTSHVFTGVINLSGTDYFGFEFCGSDICDVSEYGDLFFSINDNASGSDPEGYVQIDSAAYNWIAGDWIHVALVWDDTASSETELRVYLNGIEPIHNHSGSLGFGTVNLGSNWYIGQINSTGLSSNGFLGLIDDYQIFRYPLTETQIRTVMNNGAVSFKE